MEFDTGSIADDCDRGYEHLLTLLLPFVAQAIAGSAERHDGNIESDGVGGVRKRARGRWHGRHN